MEDILKHKTAVVYGAGSIGGAVAAAFAKAGATVFVADHHEDALKKLADKNIQTERLDVLDKDAVAAFVKSVVEKTGHVDISFCATSTVEAMLRLLAAELGPYGVRTVCLHSAGSEGAADKTLAYTNPELEKRTEGWGQRWMSRNLLGRGPTLEEVGNMAAFMASDLAGATTGTTVSLTAGMVNH